MSTIIFWTTIAEEVALHLHITYIFNMFSGCHQLKLETKHNVLQNDLEIYFHAMQKFKDVEPVLQHTNKGIL